MIRSRRIIPKENLSSYQSWQMEVIQHRPPVVSSDEEWQQKDTTIGGNGREQAVLKDEITGQCNHDTALEGYTPGFEAGQKAGYEAGYQAGYEESRNLGYTAGYEAGNACIAGKIQELEALLQGFTTELSAADQTISQDLLSLAVGFAKQMTRETLRIKPDVVCAAVRECVRQELVFAQPAQLFLHPDDAVLIRQHLGNELDGWTVCPDSQLERGGCKVKVGHSQTDATVETRWKRIVQALGQSGSWME